MTTNSAPPLTDAQEELLVVLASEAARSIGRRAGRNRLPPQLGAARRMGHRYRGSPPRQQRNDRGPSGAAGVGNWHKRSVAQ